MNIFVMRHGTTVWNEKGITQGRSNNRLSSNGIEMVEQVAKEFKNVNFDVIFCSPLMRTVQTAKIMNKYHNVKLVKDERLIEVDQGVFSRRSKATLTSEEIEIKRKRLKSYGMEKYEDVYVRTKDFVEYLKTDVKYENILIVTHNINASLIADIFDNIKVDFTNKEHTIFFKNAEVRLYRI